MGTLTVLVLGLGGPQPYAPVHVVAYFADGSREAVEAFTGRDGFAQVDVPREPFRGLVVESDGMSSEIVLPNLVGVYAVVLRPPPVPAAAASAPREVPRRRWPFRKDPWLANVGARFGFHGHDALDGVRTQYVSVLIGVSMDASVVHFGKLALAIGAVADYAPSIYYETHTYLGGRAGVVRSGKIGAVSIVLEGGQHTLSDIGGHHDPSAGDETSGPFGSTTEVSLPYAGLELAAWLRLGHLTVGPRLTLRADMGRRRSVVAGSRWIDDHTCEDDYYDPCGGSWVWGTYIEPADVPLSDERSGHLESDESRFTAGGFSAALAVMVGVDF